MPGLLHDNDEVTNSKPRGRRPGSQDTRQTIVGAARGLFDTQPYDQVSLRAIARRADVDPALVHHYFSGKAELFLTATADVSADPMEIFRRVDDVPTDRRGAALVLAFTAVWEAAGRSGRFTEFISSMLATPDLTAGAGEFITQQIRERIAHFADPDEQTLRATLAMSQMIGMAMLRYTLRMEPVTSVSRSRLAELYGPTLQHYLTGRLSAEDRRNSSPAVRD